MKKIQRTSRYLWAAVIGLPACLILITSCGGGGGGAFGGISRVVGQVFRPLDGLIESNPIPLGNAPVTVVDFADENFSRLGRTTPAGSTDANGNYSVDIQGQEVSAVVVIGETERGRVRIAGLVNPAQDNVQKNLDGITDIAAEAGLRALNQGTLSPNQFGEQRIQNLEQAAAQLLQENPGEVNFFQPSTVTAAANEIRQSTRDGDNPPTPGDFVDFSGPVVQNFEPLNQPRTDSSGGGNDDDDDDDDDNRNNGCDGADVFQCADGNLICGFLVCSGVPDCADGSDESPLICDNNVTCCQATDGCPTETPTACGPVCCCCGLNQICDRDNLENGCVTVAARASGNTSDSLVSKVLLGIPYWN